MNIPLNFIPRDYQAEALAALDMGSVMNVWCWSRRGGKDFTAFAYAVKKMVERPINVVIVWPTKKQGYDNFWTTISNDGMPVLDHIPSGLVEQRTNSPTDMHITLKNGSTLTLLGASEPEALRGANGFIYIFSEFVDIPVAALDAIRPIVLVNGGQIIIQSTPKIDGISGGTFKLLFDRAISVMKSSGKQFASRVTADAYLTKEQLDDIREETVARNGNDFWFRQEFLCDWGQASATNYYAEALMLGMRRGNVGRFPYDPAHPCFTSWDLGMSDMLAVGFWQYVSKRPRVIDYYETHDVAYESTVAIVKSKPYNIMWHFLPHDGAVRDSDAIERVEKIRQLGLPNSSLLRRELKEEGIKRAVAATPNTEFNEATTEDLRRKLSMYKRKFNGITGDYMGPEHNTNSHAADEHRYMYAAIDQEFDPKTGLFLYSPDSQEVTYDSEKIDLAPQFNPYL
jgi:hypothetical protein